jgi:prevent-host-death family protein
MKRTLSAVEARQRLGELLEGVYYRGDEVVIERAGKPMAVVVPARMYEQMVSQRDELMNLVREMWERNKGVEPDELERLITEEIRSARDEQHATSRG